MPQTIWAVLRLGQIEKLARIPAPASLKALPDGLQVRNWNVVHEHGVFDCRQFRAAQFLNALVFKNLAENLKSDFVVSGDVPLSF